MKKKMPTPKRLPSGVWRCQVMVDGHRESVTDPDPELCQAKAVALRAGMEEAVKKREQDRKGRITLGAAIDEYIEDRKPVTSPSTIRGYQDIRRLHFQSLMRMQIRDIELRDLQHCVSEEAKRVGKKTLKNVLGLVEPAIRQYRKDLDFESLKLPQRKKKEKVILQEEGMIDLLEAIRGAPTEVPILLAIWLGLRRSEICGLCWDCVDFDRHQIRIERTYVRGPDGFVLRDEAKVEASQRALECPGYIMARLAALQPDPALRRGPERIFHIHPNTIYSSLKRICAKHNIDFTGVHGLRHTNASVMAHLDVADKAAMALGGWSTDYTMKQVYQHLFTSDRDDAVRLRDDFFSAIAAGERPEKTPKD